MKHTANYYDLKKGRSNPVKKPTFLNSVIYKEVTGQLHDLTSKMRPNKQHKDVHHPRRHKQDDKPSKKSSLNHINKKTSKGEMGHLDMFSLYHKLTDNYMVDTQQDTRFEPDQSRLQHRARRDQNKRDGNPSKQSSESIKQSLKQSKTIEVAETGKAERGLFNYLYIIGKGGFGKVWKVEHKKTKNQYAMKQMLKSIVMTKKSVQSVMNQRVLLSQIHSPFLVNMHFAFQDRDTLYLVLDLMEGGDLRYHIGNRIFTQIQAKFFIACIVLGLEDLQNHQIIHRDIKPQNLVLDSRGYIRITDLGIARLYKPNNSSDTSGTPGYMSPQVICRQNHSFVSDYFALGVIAYQLMTGRRPYNGRSRNEIRDLMLAKQIQLKYQEVPDDWNEQAADFINRLIQRKPSDRLGYNGVNELKSHPWLSGLNWEKLRAKQIESPFIPMMKKSNFDQDEQITIEDEQQAELIEKNSLLLRKPQFQELFHTYYYGPNDRTATIELRQKDKKTSSKRMISGYRKSQQQHRTFQLMPEKKLSYNQVYAKKRTEMLHKPERSKPVELGGVKKRSAQFEKNFFR